MADPRQYAHILFFYRNHPYIYSYKESRIQSAYVLRLTIEYEL